MVGLASFNVDGQGFSMMFFRQQLLVMWILIVSGLHGSWSHDAHADEAPTILIEDVILNCTSGEENASMPSASTGNVDLRGLERRLHRRIANLCQGQNVCRVAALPLMDAQVRKSGCDDLVIVPVCAVEALESMTPGASSEMTLLLRPASDLVINCSSVASPHF